MDKTANNIKVVKRVIIISEYYVEYLLYLYLSTAALERLRAPSSQDLFI